MKPSPLSPPEQEVLDNLVGYELRIFRGVGRYDRKIFERGELEFARVLQKQEGGALYAKGSMPSRGPDVDGYALLPADFREG